eukprot:202907-Chlamydomonas_euryale.AAC.3
MSAAYGGQVVTEASVADAVAAAWQHGHNAAGLPGAAPVAAAEALRPLLNNPTSVDEFDAADYSLQLPPPLLLLGSPHEAMPPPAGSQAARHVDRASRGAQRPLPPLRSPTIDAGGSGEPRNARTYIPYAVRSATAHGGSAYSGSAVSSPRPYSAQPTSPRSPAHSTPVTSPSPHSRRQRVWLAEPVSPGRAANDIASG